MNAYKLLGKLGEGSFGMVALAQHKFSGVKVAIKSVAKSRIHSSFTENGQEFQELQIMEECTRS